jgi:hypothetical protein
MVYVTGAVHDVGRLWKTLCMWVASGVCGVESTKTREIVLREWLCKGRGHRKRRTNLYTF